MLDKVYDLGLVKFAGDEEKALEFVGAFAAEFLEKQATLAPDRMESPYQSLVQGFSSNLGKGIGSMLVATGVSALGNVAKLSQNSFLKTSFLAALEKAIVQSSFLKEADPVKVRDYAETIFKFGPHVATDHNLLSSLLANAIHGQGIDPMTINTIVQLEERHTGNSGFKPKNYI